MGKTFLKISRHRSIIVTGVLFIAFYFNLISADAADSWWEKGSGILRSFGEESGKETDLPVEKIGAGLRDALRVSSENVVKQLGRVDGFNKDSAIHIPLPQQLNMVKSVLAKAGMSGMFDDLELKLNRAAEQAVPKAKKLFGKAITEMTFDDVKRIYGGPEDAATQYFRSKMSSSLSAEMRPVVKNSLAEVGAVGAYDNVMAQYSSIPFVPEVKADLTDYVLEKGVDGIFHYMVVEEAAIRQNPAKRTTDLLKLVFGAK